MRATVLVTDGEERASLAVVRSLGRAGHRCVVTSGSGRSLAGASRYAALDVRVPSCSLDPAAFVEATAGLASRHAADLVIPVSEAALLALLPARDRVAARMPFPDADAVRAICDKARVLEAAAGMGIRVPRQQQLVSATAPGLDSVKVPAVLKPARSVFTTADGTRGKVGVRWARSEAELQAALRSYPAAAFPVLAQEVIAGPGIGVFVLLHGGELLARFAHRRIREKPPAGGVSVVRQSEPIDSDLLRSSLALLDRFGWSGVAMVEYKRDDATGEHVLMEVNGRFWGSLQLAIDAGVDFPRLLVEASLGQRPDPVEQYGFCRSRWFWGDVDHLLARWRDGRTGWRERTRSLAAWVRAFGPGYRSEMLRPDDPGPFLRESVYWMREALRR